MSSRARRIDPSASAVSSFPWGGESVEPVGLRPAPAPVAEASTVDHEAHLAALEREAFAKGFAQGERAGAEASGERSEAMLRRLTETLDELTTVRAEMIRQTERQMVHLALAIARRIVGREVSLDPDLLLAMARVALERLGDTARVTIRLHPDDFAASGATRVSESTGSNVTMVADPRLSRGACRVESDMGLLDVGIDAQLQAVGRALIGDDDVHGAPLMHSNEHSSHV
jgi:flagellar assembly protein FliH